MSTYLVTCATGQQGNAVIQLLHAAGARVHAVVRNPLSDKAQRLQTNGVTLFKGDNSDPAVFCQASKGCSGLFLNLQPTPKDRHEQVRQAQGILAACKDAGVKVVVLTTAFSVDKRQVWDNEKGQQYGLQGYYGAKAEMEEAVRTSGIPNWTILRPAWFHSNYLEPHGSHHFPGLLTEGVLVHSYDPGVTMLHIDEQDIGKFAAAALLDPSRFRGKEIDLGNESFTIDEVAERMSRVSGKAIMTRRRTEEEKQAVMKSVPTQRFHLWANEHKHSSESAKWDASLVQRDYGIDFTSLEDYFMREKHRLRESLPPS